MNTNQSEAFTNILYSDSLKLARMQKKIFSEDEQNHLHEAYRQQESRGDTPQGLEVENQLLNSKSMEYPKLREVIERYKHNREVFEKGSNHPELPMSFKLANAIVNVHWGTGILIQRDGYEEKEISED